MSSTQGRAPGPLSSDLSLRPWTLAHMRMRHMIALAQPIQDDARSQGIPLCGAHWHPRGACVHVRAAVYSCALRGLRVDAAHAAACVSGPSPDRAPVAAARARRSGR
eukprot:1035959-Alexandrium_andersonii.AAC.1